MINFLDLSEEFFLDFKEEWHGIKHKYLEIETHKGILIRWRID